MFTITDQAPDRGSAPVGGPNTALGSSFTTSGVPNVHLVGSRVMYTDQIGPHQAVITKYCQETETYDIVMDERQVTPDSIDTPISEVKKDDLVMYTKRDITDLALVSKVFYDSNPPYLAIQIIRRGVSETQLQTM